ncbi:heme ABC exporter ATP-binding protein CcmA [Ovoidimarina sediminis]|uniref:heme ABC exporter ATP-binding protein CcmA n=1 Tax=Ovoidimarina sediminis TaxID=3079856 RepID=UPI0029121B11|nr:heme ABC exporter ATP-binding protein CcmA [Rhodophyticola sp. MJ-SS7]MDU8945077.1 heme ABC exporter ATP-binding protein CcmA [Rhodophyticola sp. MJ-SS7]
MILSAHDISCARGGVPILSGVSFSVGPGQALVLRGPNGIGKSTLLRTLAGLQPALSGRLDAPEEGLAYAGHLDGLKAVLTVAENLVFWAEIFGTRDIAPALRAFDLTDLADRPAQNLSAGQKRRLGLARLVVTNRPVWLLDEPTVSLDAASTARFRDLIADHLAGGGAAVIATHIDLGFEAETLDLGQYRAAPGQGDTRDAFDEAFV